MFNLRLENTITSVQNKLPMSESEEQKTYRHFICLWLYTVFILLIVLLLIGGVTRLTGSGLSVTEWSPISGIIPPIGEEQWQEEFIKYQKTAQYLRLNSDMNLKAFKTIFWWEWSHRFLARLVGFTFFIPLIFFWVCGKLEQKVKRYLLGIFFLGTFQSIIGWWMVTSGLGNSTLTSVSQYRLATHLVMACFLLIAILALARFLTERTRSFVIWHIKYGAGLIVILVILQIYIGALVAGLHAGKVYNTWPLMDESLIPDGLFVMYPIWRNFFENILTVQFIHRIFAYLLLCATLFHTLNVEKNMTATIHARRATMLLVFVLLQSVIGIMTLLLQVPVFWGLVHQGVALFVLTYAVIHWIGCWGSSPFSYEKL